MSLPTLNSFASNELIAQVTSTLHEALSLRGESTSTLLVEHEGMSLGGSVDRYTFTVSQGSLTFDLTRLGEDRCGMDRIAVETRPDVMGDPQFACNLSTTLELHADSQYMGWSPHDSVEVIINLERLMDLLHVMSRAHQQMQDTAQFIKCMTAAEPDTLSA